MKTLLLLLTLFISLKNPYVFAASEEITANEILSIITSDDTPYRLLVRNSKDLKKLYIFTIQESTLQKVFAENKASFIRRYEDSTTFRLDVSPQNQLALMLKLIEVYVENGGELKAHMTADEPILLGETMLKQVIKKSLDKKVVIADFIAENPTRLIYFEGYLQNMTEYRVEKKDLIEFFEKHLEAKINPWVTNPGTKQNPDGKSP